jgi:hypothetical protein
MEAFLIIILVIGLLITWEIVKYSYYQKKINERNSSESSLRVNQPGKKSKSRTKAAKGETPHKSKSSRPKKKKKKSIKKKTDD